MEPQKETTPSTDSLSLVLELPLGGAAPTFSLEKAVCSHGLFMMAPNNWDPVSKTLTRPLRLSVDFNNSDHERSLMVTISQPAEPPDVLHLRVFGADKLSVEHQEALLSQVRRMLRLSEEENRIVREFQEVYAEAKERRFGRVFRSPTLFEDMVKCILFCNCQWSRTLTMARALCELQPELKCCNSAVSSADASDSINYRPEHFTPKTPAGKESKRKRGVCKCSIDLAERFAQANAAVGSDYNLGTGTGTVELSERVQELEDKRTLHLSQDSDPCKTSNGILKTDLCSYPSLQPSGGTELDPESVFGNFPSPIELAKVDSQFLARRCNLGYRATRITNLAQGIMEGTIRLQELEESCCIPSLSTYDKLAEQLKEIKGFGPFTCANVLMCMGFYHIIPSDSETIRHLKQAHARNSTTLTVQREVEALYGKYKPFQFLVYWSEVWHFYEEWFGNLSEMPHDEYKLITAANMRLKRNRKNKRKSS